MRPIANLAAKRAELARLVVGRDRELDLILAAGRGLLLEGPPGSSESTILRAITASWGVTLHSVEGNAELTPGRVGRPPQPGAGAARGCGAPVAGGRRGNQTYGSASTDETNCSAFSRSCSRVSRKIS
jgi:hypothetical protein